MIITLTGADFSSNNINSLLNSWSIVKKLSGVTCNNSNTSVDKNGSYSATFTLNSGYTLKTATVTMGGTDITSSLKWNPDNTEATLTINNVTGNVYINITALNESVEVTYCTITYKYVDSEGKSIKASTSENVEKGTSKTFSTSNAPEIAGYRITSVSPTSATINSNTTVTYTYTVNEASGNIAYYAINYNIDANGEPQSMAGRIAITNFFENNNKALTVSSSITTNIVAIRYYDADKKGGAVATSSTYGRVVLVINTTNTALTDVYAGQTITVNGNVYTLQPDPNDSFAIPTVSYQLGANIGADGELGTDASRVAVLDYFETNGAAITASSSIGGTAIRYYDSSKVGGANATGSVYARVVIHSLTVDVTDEKVSGSTLTVNNKTYILSNS